MGNKKKNNPKKLSFKKIWQQYTKKEIKLEKWQWLGLLMLVVVFSGSFGWLYEFIFYYFDGGTGDFYMQGGDFLPWINIYAIGALLILATTWKLRKHPWAVFLLSILTTGILEFISGWLVYVVGNGTRYWDYNTEIWNFGNIGGFVCLRSVLIFGLSALMLMYLIVPIGIWLSQKISRKAFLTLAITLFALVMLDEIYNLLASKFFNWPDAMDFYKSIGWKYLT